MHITKLQFFFAFTNFSHPYFTRKTAQRTIQREVVNDLSKRILAGRVDRSRPIRIDANDEGLTFEN